MTVELLSVDDVARITGLSMYTIRAAVRAGELSGCKLRGRIRVHPDDLAAWIDESRIQPALDVKGARQVVAPRPPRPRGTVLHDALRDLKGAA